MVTETASRAPGGEHVLARLVRNHIRTGISDDVATPVGNPAAKEHGGGARIPGGQMAATAPAWHVGPLPVANYVMCHILTLE